MRKRNLAALMVVALVVSMAAACSKNSGVRVSLDETPVISGGLGWCVITLAYVRLKTQPSYESTDSGTARRGDVARIVGRSRSFASSDAGIWYRVEYTDQTGWAHESALTVYENESEARSAAEGIH
ncbi:MAG TPA: SH3 domain-containing protein [bacterium]|nr:SH3 domain-containing protein [bacterium]